MKIRSNIFALILIISQASFSQQPVTGGEDLIPYVRALKLLGNQVHLEWLYLEDNLDRLPEQIDLVKSGRPLEFTEGYLYHGRANLDDILLSGWIPGTSYFTRAPHVWAIGSFRREYSAPAIFMLQSGQFNRLRNNGEAALEAEIDKNSGIMDPYPKIKNGFALEIVKEIWIDEDTFERYKRLLQADGKNLSPRNAALKKSILLLRETDRLKTIPGLHHASLMKSSFYPIAYEKTGKFFIQRALHTKMPRFRVKNN